MLRNFGVFSALDVGIYLDTLMLSMTDFGLSSCAQGALAIYPDIVWNLLKIDRENAVLVGLSFGYEDPLHPANTTVTDRAQLEATVSIFE